MLPVAGREEENTPAQVTPDKLQKTAAGAAEGPGGLAPSWVSSPPTFCLAGPFPSGDPGPAQSSSDLPGDPSPPTQGRPGSDVSKSVGSLCLHVHPLGRRSAP